MKITDNRLEKARAAKKAMDMSPEGVTILNPVEKLALKPTSLRLSINAACWDCCCFQKLEVTLCTATSCPLWNVRPWQRKKKGE